MLRINKEDMERASGKYEQIDYIRNADKLIKKCQDLFYARFFIGLAYKEGYRKGFGDARQQAKEREAL